MLYDGRNPVVSLIGVEHMQWTGGSFRVEPRDYSALAFRIRGTARIRCRGSELSVNMGDILYLPQNAGYTAEYTDTEMIVIHFRTRSDDRDAELYTLPGGDEVCRMFLRAHAIWSGRGPGHAMYAMAQLYAILGAIQEKADRANIPPHFMKAISFINANYRDSAMNIGAACRSAGMSETAFRKLFHRYYGRTPVDYITGLRIEHARGLIAAGMPVEAAAQESGFNDAKYFARVVRRRMGCTPRSFRSGGTAP